MKIRVLILGSGLLCLIAIISISIFRIPSYSIKTEGKLYIVNKGTSSVTVFDLEKGKELAELPISVEPHEATTLNNSVILSNYGNASDVGKSLSVINPKNNQLIKTIDLGSNIKPHGIVAIPNSNNVAVVTDVNSALLVVNVKTGLLEKRIPTLQEFSHLLVLHPFKPLAYVSNTTSSSVSVIDLELEQVIKIIPCGWGTEGIDITPDGKEIWVTNSKENSLYTISTDNYQITDTLPTGIQPLRLKFSLDGKLCLVTNAKDGNIFIYNRHLKKQVKTITIPGKKNIVEKIIHKTPRPVCVLMHPNGLFAFISNSNANRIEVVDLNTLTIVSSIASEQIPDGLAILK